MKVFCIDNGSSLREQSKCVAQYLQQHENMETSRFLTPDGEYAVHGRVRNGGIRRLIGADKQVVVRMRLTEDGRAEVILDAPVWKDKLTVASVSLLMFWPLFFTALYGAWDQHALFRRLQKLLQAGA